MTTNLTLDVNTHPQLELSSVIGFGGKVPSAMYVHPNGRDLVYTLGSCLVIRQIGDPRADEFLRGHSNAVSCVTVSPSGKYVASGQITHMGFQADICVFDFASRKRLHRFSLHKVKVQALAFSHDEQYLSSLGGQDDGTLVVWDLESGRPLCGGPVSSDVSLCTTFFRTRSDKLITGGVGTLRVWGIDPTNRKIHPTDVNLGAVRRVCKTIIVAPSDQHAYVGTGSGDVLCIQLKEPYSIKFQGPVGQRLKHGVVCCALTDGGMLVAGSGGGDVVMMNCSDLRVVRMVTLQGQVTSVGLHGDHLFVGTDRSNVYYVSCATFKEELRQTCHYERINDVAFPHNYSELFATCSNHDIRIWNAETSQELLRIRVQGLECNCVAFTKDGKMVVSGWSDGKIRAFGPQSGKLLYVITDAHKTQGMKKLSGTRAGVTAICVDNSNQRILSGGADSQVRVWSVSKTKQVMDASMKEHKATVNAICIRSNDRECISASDDGSCIVWDLQRCMRRGIMYAQTYFKATQYFPDESQMLTTGSDKKITYFDAFEYSAIRELEGSKIGEINSLDISPGGALYVTGGGDRILKVWSYDAGAVLFIGLGHSGCIQKCRFSPDGRYIVSVGDEGGIFVWRVPEECLGAVSQSALEP
eukprot:TRINITY_DN4531_c0_g3_i1.p1 TRINITY_DN4531_c0_g3~~TRINITY_DN4531_c0_g3_i1.p1  ORF type:complete len:672 (+),score=195.13 TRINITY_DN4531_c0_g3_i1:96-2018(+)